MCNPTVAGQAHSCQPPDRPVISKGMSAGPAASTWAPLRNGVFRALWLAVLVSNIGAWMQTVGAQWLLVHQPHASILVALVQTADYLPDFMFGLVGGVLADSFDRRRLLMAVQAFLLATGLALAVLTVVGQMPPALLLIFTFLLGAGTVLTVPAYQALARTWCRARRCARPPSSARSASTWPASSGRR